MGFVLLSKKPLALAWRGFASESECEALLLHAEAARNFAAASSCELCYDIECFSRIAQLNGKCYMEVDADRAGMSEDARGMVDRVDHAVSELFGITPREEQWQSVVNCTPEAPAGATPGLLNGLHVDTANDEPLRYATSLLYLRSVHLGGETLFSTQAEAGAVLLEAGIEATFDDRLEDAQQQRQHPHLEDARRTLEAGCRSLVPPEAGTLIVFYSRRPDGTVDPAAFHGSAIPLSGEKWTLQTFWAAPAAFEHGPEAYARERHARRRFFFDLDIGDSALSGTR